MDPRKWFWYSRATCCRFSHSHMIPHVPSTWVISGFDFTRSVCANALLLGFWGWVHWPAWIAGCVCCNLVKGTSPTLKVILYSVVSLATSGYHGITPNKPGTAPKTFILCCSKPCWPAGLWRQQYLRLSFLESWRRLQSNSIVSALAAFAAPLDAWRSMVQAGKQRLD
jgi:hypothetical protein